MASKFELTKDTKISVSNLPATEANPASAVFVTLSDSMKDIQHTQGQKDDIDVTVFSSREKEMVNGLASPGEFTISGNWSPDDGAQEIMRQAHDNDTSHAFKIVFTSGSTYAFLAEVRQYSWGAQANGVVTGSFTLRQRGKTIHIEKAKGPK